MKPLSLKTLVLAACAVVTVAETKAYDLAKDTRLKSWLEDNNLLVESQFRYLELPFEVNYNREVARYIERYLRPGRRETERLMGKAAYYFPIFEEALRKYDLPVWLKYLPIVESGLHAGIESPAGAVGLWQFMPATAAFFDLRIEERIDERRDPYRSSEAAAQLLRHLYDRFGDWSLTLAAYNCGPAKVKRAIDRAKVASYEAIKNQLPGQTQRYITKLKAAAYVANYYDFFGLKARPDVHLRGKTVLVTLEETMSFREIAQRAGISVETVRALNPACLAAPVPVEGEEVRLRLPAAAASQWQAAGPEEQNNQTAGSGAGAPETPQRTAPGDQEYRKPVKTNDGRPSTPAVAGTLPQPERLPAGEGLRKSALLRLQRQELRIF